MKARHILAFPLLVTASCEPYIPLCDGLMIDACRKAEDLAHHLAAQVADASATGDASIGEAGVLGATGKMTLGVRSTVARRESPRLGNTVLRVDGTAGASSFEVENTTVTSIMADAAVGAYGGLRVGQTRVGGVDLLGGLSLMPAPDGGSVRVSSAGRVGLTLGARLGVLEETRVIPAVSLTVIARGVPSVRLTGERMPMADGNTAVIEVPHVDIYAHGLRLAASKRIARLGVSAGVGRDDYHVSTSYVVTTTNPESPGGQAHTTFDIRRNTVFGGASLALGGVTVAAEASRVFGGEMPAMLNTFGARPANAARTQLTFGVRLPAGRTHDVVGNRE